MSPIVSPSGKQGGGSQPVNSFLGASQAASQDLTTMLASLVYTFPADKVIGSDVTLSANGTTLTFVNDGIYSVLVNFVAGATLVDSVSVAMAATLNANSALNSEGPFNWQEEIQAGKTATGFNNVPAMYFHAGDTIGLQAFSTAGGSNARIESSNVIIARVL